MLSFCLKPDITIYDIKFNQSDIQIFCLTVIKVASHNLMRDSVFCSYFMIVTAPWNLLKVVSFLSISFYSYEMEKPNFEISFMTEDGGEDVHEQ